MIDLFVGRIRVHIEHLGTTPNPNRVLTPTAVISVRGTTFDVSVNDDDETTVIEVEDGLVEVRHALLPSDSPKLVHPGETLKVYKSQPLEAGIMKKGTVLQFLYRAVMDAANVASMRRTTGTISTGVGDHSGKAPPPPPPPAPPPPPPGH